MLNRELREKQAVQYPDEPGSGVNDSATRTRSPFVVGASGHRNLVDDDLARARRDVVSFFDTVRALLPDTELTVILGMTSGGDLMVAETALELGIRELIWQYKNQLAHFARSSSELERTAAPNRRTELLVELGRRSLMESYLWTIHRYHREHAPPAGG